MEKEENRYLDFSDDEWILDTFDPDCAIEPANKLIAVEIRKYLQVNNPVSAIKGLVAFQTIMSAGQAIRIDKGIRWTNMLLSVNAAILAYIAYTLSLA